MASLLRGVLALLALLVLVPGGLVGAGATAAAPAAQDDAGVMAELMARAEAGESISGPSSGVLVQAPDRVTFAPAGVGVRDFYARVRFTNPTDSAGAPWDIGLGFRDAGGADQYRLILDAASVWYLAVHGAADQGGSPIPGFSAAPGGENLIDLVVADDRAYFSVNGVYVATLDVSAIGAAGEVWVGTAFREVTTVEGARTPYAEFQVWSLDAAEGAAPPAAGAPSAEATPAPAAAPAPDPAADAAAFERLRDAARSGASLAGPVNGELVQSVGEAAVLAAGVDVRDFYARARFASPRDTGAAGWDYGFIFRDLGGNDHYRLIVDATGSWYLSIGPGPAFAAGPAPALNLEPGGVNTLELVAVEGVGYFAVNGEFLTRLDLSPLGQSGDVWVGTAFFAESTAEGAVTRYRDFEVWPLPAAAAPAGTPVAAGSEPARAATPGAEPAGEGESVGVRLAAQGDSGVSGLAVLLAAGAQSQVDLALLGATGEELVLIHEGTCAELDPAPAFPLRDLDDSGRSRTILDVPLSTLTDAPHAVVLRQSAAEYGTVVACGDIGG